METPEIFSNRINLIFAETQITVELPSIFVVRRID